MDTEVKPLDQQERFDLKKLPRGSDDVVKLEFMANGKKYLIEKSISFQRFNRYEEMELMIGYGVNVKKLSEAHGELFGMMNERMFAEASVRIHNLRVGLAQMDEEDRVPMGVQLCCLFINRENEDRRWINEEMIRAKKHDWEMEGYDPADFFGLAVSTLKDCFIAYSKATQDTSLLKETLVSESLKGK